MYCFLRGLEVGSRRLKKVFFYFILTFFLNSFESWMPEGRAGQGRIE